MKMTKKLPVNLNLNLKDISQIVIDAFARAAPISNTNAPVTQQAMFTDCQSFYLPHCLITRLMILVLTATFIFFSSANQAQEKPENTEAIVTDPQAQLPSRQEQFQLLLKAIKEKENELDKYYAIRRMAIVDDRPELDEKINKLNTLIKDLHIQFSTMATDGYNLTGYVEEPDISIDWKKDIAQVAYPLLRELKKITARARTIEYLTVEIDFLKERRQELSNGINNLKNSIADITDKQLLKKFRQIEQQASDNLQDVEQRISILSYKLNDELNNESPLWGSITDLLTRFAGNMLLHLLLAVTAAWLTYKIIKVAAKVPLYILGKSDTSQRVFVERSVNLGTSVLAWLAAMMMLIIVLYSFSEWAMLALIIIMLIAVLFSMKDVVPQYLVEARTLINLGPVRQGERVVYNDIPWKVSRLDVYTRLYNPALSAVIRVPITTLSVLNSRPFHTDEPWFPSKTGDCVITTAGHYGKVIRQTPEVVQLDHAGAIISYRTRDFLEQTPTNLSENGFSLFSTFGIDYQHQQQATTTILEQLEAFIHQTLIQSTYGELSTRLRVEFSSANSSSLDYKIIAGFSGDAAPYYYPIQRWLQKTCVDCANEYDWGIPFQQITLHQGQAG